jgi:nitrate reductase NapAB chaperone NapD
MMIIMHKNVMHAGNRTKIIIVMESKRVELFSPNLQT